LGLSLDDIEKGFATLRDLRRPEARAGREALGSRRAIFSTSQNPRRGAARAFQGSRVGGGVRRAPARALGAEWMTFDLPRAAEPRWCARWKRLAER